MTVLVQVHLRQLQEPCRLLNHRFLCGDLLLARPGLQQVNCLHERRHTRFLGLLSEDRFLKVDRRDRVCLGGRPSPIHASRRCLELRPRAIQFRLRPGDLFRPRPVTQFIQPGLGGVQLPARLQRPGAVLVILKPHQRLSRLNLVGTFDSHPRHPAHHLRRQLDLVRGDDVPGGVQHDPFAADARRLHLNRLHLHDRRRPTEEPGSAAHHQQQQHHPDPLSPRAIARVFVRSIDLEVAQFTGHRSSFPERCDQVASGGRSRRQIPTHSANHRRKHQAVHHDRRGHLELKGHF